MENQKPQLALLGGVEKPESIIDRGKANAMIEESIFIHENGYDQRASWFTD